MANNDGLVDVNGGFMDVNGGVVEVYGGVMGVYDGLYYERIFTKLGFIGFMLRVHLVYSKNKSSRFTNNGLT